VETDACNFQHPPGAEARSFIASDSHPSALRTPGDQPVLPRRRAHPRSRSAQVPRGRNCHPACPLNCGDVHDPPAGPQSAAELARNHDTAAPADHAKMISAGRVEIDPAGRARPAHVPKDSLLTVSATPRCNPPIRADRRIFAFVGRMDCSGVFAQITLICTIADLLLQ
jgi:hypothetical protein